MHPDAPVLHHDSDCIKKAYKRRQRRREDAAVLALLWSAVIAIAASIGAVYYLIIRLANSAEAFINYAMSLIE